MACSKCKKKVLTEDIKKEMVKMEKITISIVMFILLTSLYGLYSLIVNFL